MVTVGDVLVTADSVLVPQGRFPLAGTTWTVRDTTTIVATTPRYARALAFGFSFLVAPLLLLKIKDHHYEGNVLVTVVGEGLYHTVRFPPGPESRAYVASLVNEARALAAAASAASSTPTASAAPPSSGTSASSATSDPLAGPAASATAAVSAASAASGASVASAVSAAPAASGVSVASVAAEQ